MQQLTKELLRHGPKNFKRLKTMRGISCFEFFWLLGLWLLDEMIFGTAKAKDNKGTIVKKDQTLYDLLQLHESNDL